MQIRAPNVWFQSKSKCSLESIPHCKVYLKRFWTNMKHSDLIEDNFVSISWNRFPKFWQHQTLTIPNSVFQLQKAAECGFCAKGMKHSNLLGDSFVTISSSRSPKFWQLQMLTLPNSLFLGSKSSRKWFLCRSPKFWEHQTLTIANWLFPASKCSQKWLLCQTHGSLKRHLETVLSAFRQIARWNFTNSLKTTVLSLL